MESRKTSDGHQGSIVVLGKQDDGGTVNQRRKAHCIQRDQKIQQNTTPAGSLSILNNDNENIQGHLVDSEDSDDHPSLGAPRKHSELLGMAVLRDIEEKPKTRQFFNYMDDFDPLTIKSDPSDRMRTDGTINHQQGVGHDMFVIKRNFPNQSMTSKSSVAVLECKSEIQQLKDMNTNVNAIKDEPVHDFEVTMLKAPLDRPKPKHVKLLATGDNTCDDSISEMKTKKKKSYLPVSMLKVKLLPPKSNKTLLTDSSAVDDKIYETAKEEKTKSYLSMLRPNIPTSTKVKTSKRYVEKSKRDGGLPTEVTMSLLKSRSQNVPATHGNSFSPSERDAAHKLKDCPTSPHLTLLKSSKVTALTHPSSSSIEKDISLLRSQKLTPLPQPTSASMEKDIVLLKNSLSSTPANYILRKEKREVAMLSANAVAAVPPPPPVIMGDLEPVTVLLRAPRGVRPEHAHGLPSYGSVDDLARAIQNKALQVPSTGGCIAILKNPEFQRKVHVLESKKITKQVALLKKRLDVEGASPFPETIHVEEDEIVSLLKNSIDHEDGRGNEGALDEEEIALLKCKLAPETESPQLDEPIMELAILKYLKQVKSGFTSKSERARKVSLLRTNESIPVDVPPIDELQAEVTLLKHLNSYSGQIEDLPEEDLISILKMLSKPDVEHEFKEDVSAVSLLKHLQSSDVDVESLSEDQLIAVLKSEIKPGTEMKVAKDLDTLVIVLRRDMPSEVLDSLPQQKSREDEERMLQILQHALAIESRPPQAVNEVDSLVAILRTPTAFVPPAVFLREDENVVVILSRKRTSTESFKEDIFSTLWALPMKIGRNFLDGMMVTSESLLQFSEDNSASDIEIVNAEAKSAFVEMAKRPPFRCTRLLLLCLLSILGDFKSNVVSADTFKRRLLEVANALGNTTDGLAALIDTSHRQLDESQLYQIDAVLSKAMRYMLRFVGQDSLLFMTVGMDPMDKLKAFDYHLHMRTNEVLVHFGAPTTTLLRGTPKYAVACNLREVLKSPRFRFEKDIEVDDAVYLAELKALETVVTNVEDKSVSETTQSTVQLIKQEATRDFWVKEFGRRQIISVAEFCDRLANHLISVRKEDDIMGGILPMPEQEARMLTTILETVIVKTFTCDAIGNFDALEIAKVVRVVPHAERCLRKVFETVIKFGMAKCKRVMPPPPSCHSIVWNPNQREDLVEFLNGPPGWLRISGTRYAGKTTRVLDVIHDLPLDRDVLWVDLTNAFSQVEVVSRIICQLGIRDCFSQDDFQAHFGRLLDSLKDRSVVVFDNFPEVVSALLDEGDRTDEEDDFSSSFRPVIPTLLEREKRLHVIVVGTKKVKIGGRGAALYRNEIFFSTLTPENAELLAQDIFPFDADTLKIAGRCLAGEMARLARFSHIEGLRKLKGIVLRGFFFSHGALVEGNHHSSSRVLLKECRDSLARDLAFELGPDEALCASCLLKGTAPFDAGLGWSLCKKAFDSDIVRWKVAWRGLLECGWLLHNPDLGFVVPTNSLVVDDDRSSISEETQWNTYLEYWAREAVRINNEAASCSSALISFDCNRTHFKFLFLSLYKNISRVLPYSFGDKTSIANILAGNMGRFLNYRFTSAGGVVLAHAIADVLVDGENGAFVLAMCDFAMQLGRAGYPDEALQNLNHVMEIHPCWSLPAVRVRSFAVRGLLLHTMGRLKAAEVCYQDVLDLWPTTGLPMRDVNCLEVKICLADVKKKIIRKPGLGTIKLGEFTNQSVVSPSNCTTM